MYCIISPPRANTHKPWWNVVDPFCSGILPLKNTGSATKNGDTTVDLRNKHDTKRGQVVLAQEQSGSNLARTSAA